MVVQALPRGLRYTAVRAVDDLVMEVLPASERSLAGATWRGLEEIHGAGVADSWDWVETWLDHYGDVLRHRFAVGIGSHGPRGIALLVEGSAQRRGPLPVRTLHLGTAGEPESDTVRVQHNRPLVAPADRAAFARALLRILPSTGLRYDELVLDGFAPEDIAPFLRAESAFQTRARICHVADLRSVREGGGTVLAALRGGTGNKVRRSRKRLEEAHGPLRIEWAERLDEAEAIYDEMVALHQRRWESAGEPGKFASAHFDGFHRDLVRRLFPRGRVALARVAAGETTVGCDYDLIERGRMLGYQWGLGKFEDAGISAGLVTGVAVMQAAMERGLDEYDWLAGDVLYKRQLATTTREMVWARMPHGTRGHLIDSMIRARRAYRRARGRQDGCSRTG